MRNAKISHNEFYTHSTGYRNTYARQSPYRFARTKSNKQRIFFAVLVILIHRLRNIYILSGNLPDKKTTTARWPTTNPCTQKNARTVARLFEIPKWQTVENIFSICVLLSCCSLPLHHTPLYNTFSFSGIIVRTKAPSQCHLQRDQSHQKHAFRRVAFLQSIRTHTVQLQRRHTKADLSVFNTVIQRISLSNCEKKNRFLITHIHIT